MASAEISGSSPCTLINTSTSGICPATAATRSVPLGRLSSVITASPPNAETAASSCWQSTAMVTPTGRRAREAASKVCCSRVLPVSRSSSFWGKRVEARRAGMTMRLVQCKRGKLVVAEAVADIIQIHGWGPANVRFAGFLFLTHPQRDSHITFTGNPAASSSRSLSLAS